MTVVVVVHVVPVHELDALGAAARRLGVYWELYNVTNRNNFGNPFNERTSALFNQLTSVGAPRTMQLGLRYSSRRDAGCG
jgi:hypothetical protein